MLAHGLQLFAERAVDDVLDAVRAVGEYLGDENVRKLVHRETRQRVGLAEDEAAAAEVVRDGPAVFEGVFDAALKELGAKALVGVVREDAHAYFAGLAVKARAQPGALLREYVGYAALPELAAALAYLLGVDPGMTGARCGLGLFAYHHRWKASLLLHTVLPYTYTILPQPWKAGGNAPPAGVFI